jgi:chorismate mutase
MTSTIETQSTDNQDAETAGTAAETAVTATANTAAATSTASETVAEDVEGQPPTGVGGVLGVRSGRERIDALDAELIALIERRVAVSGEIQASRLAEGGRRLDLRRETEVIGRYNRALGRPGTAVAMALLELGRGRV